MRIKLSLLILIIPATTLTTFAQRPVRKGVTVNQPVKKERTADYSVSQLEGRWQEVKRFNADNKKPVDFSDSLLMKFTNGKVELKDETSMKMSVNGEAQIEAPNELTVAGDVYTILSLDKNKLVINDGEFIKEFERRDQFRYETVGKIKVEKDSFANPVNIDLNNLKGKWLVYSRKAAPGTIKKETPVIKSLNIISVSSDGIAFGDVVFYTADISKSSSFQLATKDGNIKIVTDKQTWSLNAYKLSNDEFVFGDTGGLLYFSKHL